MPAAARKSADAASAAEEPQSAPAEAAGPEETVAEEATAEAAPVEEFRPSVTVVFNGQAESHVAGVGLCVPDVSYPVPAAVADEVCRTPLFTRVAE